MSTLEPHTDALLPLPITIPHDSDDSELSELEGFDSDPEPRKKRVLVDSDDDNDDDDDIGSSNDEDDNEEWEGSVLEDALEELHAESFEPGGWLSWREWG